jgi:phage terminase large subunit-like protein
MTPATARFYEAVVNGALTHSGNSRLARHIGNAVLREDARGARLAKERKDSPRRIDAAVAAVMAHDRAAALAGAVGTASTSRRDLGALRPRVRPMPPGS